HREGREPWDRLFGSHRVFAGFADFPPTFWPKRLDGDWPRRLRAEPDGEPAIPELFLPRREDERLIPHPSEFAEDPKFVAADLDQATAQCARRKFRAGDIPGKALDPREARRLGFPADYIEHPCEEPDARFLRHFGEDLARKRQISLRAQTDAGAEQLVREFV